MENRIEYYFTEQPNQDPKIKTTDSIYPITGDVLPLIPDPNPFGDIEYDVDFENENLKVSGLSQSIENQTASSEMIMSDAISYTGANDQPSFLNYMKKVENSSIINKTPKSFRHSSPEGGLDTVGFGHKLTVEEQKTNTIYGYNIDNLTIEQVTIFSNKILIKLNKF